MTGLPAHRDEPERGWGFPHGPVPGPGLDVPEPGHRPGGAPDPEWIERYGDVSAERVAELSERLVAAECALIDAECERDMYRAYATELRMALSEAGDELDRTRDVIRATMAMGTRAAMALGMVTDALDGTPT